MLSPAPSAVTSKGLTIINFSSPHEFKFDDGTVLPACTPERSKALVLDQHETVISTKTSHTDVHLKFQMNETVYQELLQISGEIQSDSQEPTIILVPLPVEEALDDVDTDYLDQLELQAYNKLMQYTRVVRIADRVNKIAFHNKFCV